MTLTAQKTQSLKIMDELSGIPSFIWGIIGFLLVQVVNYIIMKQEHKGMLKSINGIGGKLTAFGEKQAAMGERLASIEGFLKCQSSASQKHKVP